MLLDRYGEDSLVFSGHVNIEEKSVIVDGMPLLHVVPVLSLKTFQDYFDFLIQRRLKRYLSESKEIHVLFDVPQIWGFNLKHQVQEKRDFKNNPIENISAPSITDSTPIPARASKWGNFLSNYENKVRLVHYIREKLLEMSKTLPSTQSIIIGGCIPDNCTY